MHICIQTYVLHTCIYMYMHIYTYTCVSMYIQYTHTYMYTHIHTYIYTHMHTYILFFTFTLGHLVWSIRVLYGFIYIYLIIYLESTYMCGDQGLLFGGISFLPLWALGFRFKSLGLGSKCFDLQSQLPSPLLI